MEAFAAPVHAPDFKSSCAGSAVPTILSRPYVHGGLGGHVRGSARGFVEVRAVGYTLGDTPDAGARGYPGRVLLLGRDEGKHDSLSELIFLVRELPEGGFTARALGTSIFTEAEISSRGYDRVRDAVRCHFDEGQRPKVIPLHFVVEEIITA